MHCAEVGVGKQPNQVRLGRFLEGEQRGRLKAQVRLDVLGNLAHQPLKGQLANEQVRSVLVVANLAKSKRARPEAEANLALLWFVTLLWLLAARLLAGRIAARLLTARLAADQLASSLLDTSHFREVGAQVTFALCDTTVVTTVVMNSRFYGVMDSNDDASACDKCGGLEDVQYVCVSCEKEHVCGGCMALVTNGQSGVCRQCAPEIYCWRCLADITSEVSQTCVFPLQSAPMCKACQSGF